jgi:hypothetical protein
VDQYIDNRQKEIFWNLLANPADEGASNLQGLERLVNDHPQSAILQAMVARAKGGQTAGKAATYIDPRLLQKLISNPQGLPAVDRSSVTDLISISKNGFSAPAIAQEPVAVADTVIVDPYEAIREPEPPAITEEEQIVAQPAAEEQHIPEQVAEQEPEDVAEGPVSEEGQQIVTDVTVPEQRFGQPIDEEPIDEITEAPQVFSTPEQIKEAITSVAERTEQQPEAEQRIENNFITEDIAAEQPAAEAPVEQAPAVAEENTPEAPAENEYRFAPRFPKREAPVTQEPEYPKAAEPIEDEVYDEIVGIDDIGFKPMTDEPNAETATEHRFSEPEAEPAQDEEVQQPSVQFHQPADAASEPVQEYREGKDEEEKLILGGIVGGDYLSFDKKLDELRDESGYVSPKFKPEEPVQQQQTVAAEEKEPEPEQPQARAEQHASAHTIDPNHVSRYDDDKMPYTFLWWLNKTRKEHAENLRPYAERGVQQVPGNVDGLKRADELQQQYFENIFSLTSVSGVERDSAPERVEFDPEKKEDVIIERFIQADPQIKPLSADKLDNENKAKRSSEDSNEVVTETLARIYADQMLYHKAIATYKKLILKFPEKSTYFAGRIEELEKKTN